MFFWGHPVIGSAVLLQNFLSVGLFLCFVDVGGMGDVVIHLKN